MRRLLLTLGIVLALCAVAHAQAKISDLPAATTATSDDLLVVVDSPAGTPATKKITFGDFSVSLFGSKTTTDLAEGTNLYWTASRFNTAFGSKSTTDLAEGSNLYFTNARARAAFSFSAPLSFNSGTGALSITQADATHDGYLTQGDWSTFNGKQAALGFTPENSANKDAASGYAGLDASSLLKAAEFPAFTGDATKPAGSLVTTVVKVNGNTPGGSCTNQFVRSLSSSAVPTCASVANADLSNSSITLNGGAGFGLTVPGPTSLGSTGVFGSTSDNLRFSNLGLGVAAPTSGGQIAATGGANNITLLTLKRNTDTSPTGNFTDFQNAAGTSLWKVDITGSLAAGTVPNARVSGLAASATTDTTQANNIASGSVSNTEFQYLDGVTSAIQTQLDAKALSSFMPTYARVTGSNATTSSATLVDITGLSVPLSASTTYEVEVWLSVNNSADTNGIQFALQYSAAGATVEAQLIGTFTATAVRTDRLSALNTASGNRYVQASGIDGVISIKGIVTTGVNTGNLTTQYQKPTAGTATVRIGSFLKVTKIQ